MNRRDSDLIRHAGGPMDAASSASGASAAAYASLGAGPSQVGGASPTTQAARSDVVETPDVFLSYNRRDTGPAEHIAGFLRGAGLRVFFDRWILEAGSPWMGNVEQAIHATPAVIVLLGPNDMGDWQRAESELALNRQRRGEAVRVVPVLLRGADPPLGFLGLNTWVDLSGGYEDRTLLDHLVATVRGSRANAVPALCPYRGLRPFRQEDAAFFFGRDEFVNRARRAVETQPLTAVVGASGSGKSSAILAGLLPRLREDEQSSWTFVVMRPGREPFHTLAASLDPAVLPIPGDEQRIANARSRGDALRDGRIALRHVLDEKRGTGPGVNRLLVFVDQWEELYTVCDDAAVRSRFIDSLIDAAGNGVSILFTVRGDFFDDVLEHRALADRLQGRFVSIGPMTDAELRACIEGPASKVGLSFEDGLVDTIVRDVEGEAGSLPLLEFVLKELWEMRRGTWLVAQAYSAMGGLRGAIAERADNELASFDAPDRDLVKRVMLELVTIGAAHARWPTAHEAAAPAPEVGLAGAGSDTRRRATRADIGEAAWTVVPPLVEARLLVTSFDETIGQETVEVAHEALIRHWGRLRAWLNEDREFLLWHQRLRSALESFEARPDDHDTLLRGALLEEAKRWRDARRPRLAARELAFMTRSEQRARRLRSRRVANLAFLALAMCAIAYGTIRFRSVRARSLAMLHASILDAAAALPDPLIAALLLAELDPQNPPPSGPRIAREVADRAIPMAVLAPERNGLVQVRVSPDGSRVITAHADGRLLRWNADGGDPVELVGEGDPLRDVQLDEDGQLIALVTDAGSIRLLRIDDGVEVRPWGSVSPPNAALARFAAGRIVVASPDGRVSLWPVRGGGSPVHLRTGLGTPRDLLASPDGTRLALVIDSLVEIWPVTDQGSGQPRILHGHDSRIVTAAMAAAGSRLVTGSYDGVVRSWDLDAGSSHVAWSSGASPVWRVSLDSAGERFVAAAGDGRVCVGSTRNAADAVPVPACHSHDGEATVARVSLDGQRVLSGGTDSTVIVRPITANGFGTPLSTPRPDRAAVLRGHRGPILDAVFSADGSRIVTASYDGTVRIWRGELREDPEVARAVAGAALAAKDAAGLFIAMAGHDGGIRTIDAVTLETSAVAVPGIASALALDGVLRHVAIGTTAGGLYVRGLAGAGESFDLAGHASSITSIAFDVTGTRLVTASADSTARIWTGPAFADVRVLSGHADLVHFAVFDATATRVVTAAEDGTARIWPLDAPDDVHVLRHRGPVRHVAFSRDGSRVATASQDGTIGVWTADGDSLFVLRGHERAVAFVEFDASGERLVSASLDQTARIWALDRTEQPAVLRGHRKQLRTARFSPDGTLVVTASLDSTARVFARGETGESIVLAHGDVLRDAFFTPDQSRVVTLGEDGTMRVWRIAWNALLAYLESSTRACLAVDDRTRFLGESPDDAADAHRRCMEQHAPTREDPP
ncbi:MAG: toll/interleukin-1 receptor domain-containing protein [Longimicrobiales bacterium]